MMALQAYKKDEPELRHESQTAWKKAVENACTRDERYQNLIRLLRMMMVFSSNSACSERSGSAMSLIKTNHRNLSGASLVYPQILYTYRVPPEQLDWDRMVSRFWKNQTNKYSDYFCQP